MRKKTDVFPVAVTVYFLPVQNRVPLKFGHETVHSVVCARVSMRVANANGKTAEGWGETPLSVSWVWPSTTLTYDSRLEALREFTIQLTRAWLDCEASGHPLEIGHAFLEEALPRELQRFNATRGQTDQVPWLAALVCCSAFDIALHDAFGNLNAVPIYETYNSTFMHRDLESYLSPAEGSQVSFTNKYPADFFQPRRHRLPAWHLVGGKDLILEEELTGNEPKDGYPILLKDWIERDGLRCLKIKLCGNDAFWDYRRILEVGRVSVENGVSWLTADFNCTVTDPNYVTAILDRLLWEEPRLYGMLLYIEQPFPYDLHDPRIDVHGVSARKPLLMDESAHDWEAVRLGRELGWTGVALKTCKTQTGAILSLCWAKAHGMSLMVQDLTNPMLAQIPHLSLAAHAGTMMGVETNSMQFYPEASRPEAAVHPGLYQRRGGEVDLSSIEGSGFGYRAAEISRELPKAAAAEGEISPAALYR
ncbi:MAG TPA: enolase C-terminal domain-like protein [Verrucomicrobiae bacterium]|nr:enolase C-terminal domain-like protein [Verrucomicrobiae bacterium]